MWRIMTTNITLQRKESTIIVVIVDEYVVKVTDKAETIS